MKMEHTYFERKDGNYAIILLIGNFFGDNHRYAAACNPNTRFYTPEQAAEAASVEWIAEDEILADVMRVSADNNFDEDSPEDWEDWDHGAEDFALEYWRGM